MQLCYYLSIMLICFENMKNHVNNTNSIKNNIYNEILIVEIKIN